MPSDRFESQMDQLLAKMDRQNELLGHLVDAITKSNEFRERADKRADGYNPNK